MKLLRHLITGLSALIVVVCAGAALLFSLPSTGWKTMDIATGSMRPAMPPGTLVIVHRVPDNDLKVGDVITYKSLLGSHQSITHRIIRESTVGGHIPVFVTKGDANKTPDLEVVAGQVVGKVVVDIPILGGLLSSAQKPIGRALLVVLPGLAIVLYELEVLRKSFQPAIEERRDEANSRPGARPNSPVKAASTLSTDNPNTSPTKAPMRRGLDGMSVRNLALIGVAVIAIGVGYTHAQIQSNTVTLANNRLAVGSVASPSPTPSPSPSPCTASITGTTGPGSVNIAKCTSTTTNTTTNSNTITVTNTNNQNSTTGSSTGTTGSSTNNNTTTTNVTNITY